MTKVKIYYDYILYIIYYLLAGLFCWFKVTYPTQDDIDAINEYIGGFAYEQYKSMLQLSALLLRGLILPLAIIMSIFDK